MKVKEFRECEMCGFKSDREIFFKDGFHLIKCPKCNLVYVGNPPSDKEREDLYSAKTGYHSKKKSNQESKHKVATQLKRIEKYSKVGNILDVGCSKGFFLLEARNRGWEVKGIEISKEASQYARDINKLDVKAGELGPKSFSKEEFDVVYLGDVIEHLESPRETLRNIKEFMKKNGILVLTTPNIDGLSPKVSGIFSKKIGIWTHPTPPAHLFQFSKKTLKKTVEMEGFKVLKIYDNGRSVESPLADFRARQIYKTPRGIIYCALFIPLSFIGQLIKSSSSITLVAKNV